MAITQTPHEPSMGVCQGLRDHCLRTTRLVHTKTHAKERDRDTQADIFTQKMDLCVLLAFRQTNCL